jgi:hypothetical protein
MRRHILIAAGYLFAVTLWIYGAAEPMLWYASDADAAFWFSLLAVVHVGTGLGVGRAWAPLLAFAMPLLAYPAGYADRGEWMIWQGLALLAPIGALLLFAGVALRVVLTKHRRPAAAGPRSLV